MRAAIYARRSTEQVGRAEEAKSVTRQIENARAFAILHGWTVAEEHIFADDGVSGAEFERRPGFMRLMNSLKPRSPFSVVIVSEQKSIGRESSETPYRIKQLAQAGVEVWSYVDKKSLTPRNWMDKAMSSLRSAADEAHREDTSRRVHESHTGKVTKGYVVGGRVFGYRNVDIIIGEDVHGRPLRSHVEREIVPHEAEVVHRIFELYASGIGMKAIAKKLTLEQAAEPTPFKKKDGSPPRSGWAPSTVRTILTREIYRGVVVWNRSRKRTDWGNVNQQPRPESEWIRSQRPELRIVSDDLWFRCESRRKEVQGKAVRFSSGRLSGRPPIYAIKNLLAGLATCGVCGGGLVVETTAKKDGRVPAYVCHRRRHIGNCTNDLKIPASELNEAVLQAVEAHALTPEAIEQVIQLTERDDAREQQEQLEKEARDVASRIRRLTEAIESGADAASLVARIRELETRQTAIAEQRRNLQPIPRLPEQVVQDRLAEWRRLLRQSVSQARAVLQRIIAGRIVFTPLESTAHLGITGVGYAFKASTRFDKLFTGVAVPRPASIAAGRAGTDHIGPDDTFDADYGRLLERAYGKGVTSPAGFEPALPA